MKRDTRGSGYQKKPHDALHRANAHRMLCDGMPRQDCESQSNQHERDQLPWTFGMLEQQKLGAHSEQANKKNRQDERAHGHCSNTETIPTGYILGAAIIKLQPIVALTFGEVEKAPIPARKDAPVLA